MIQAKELRIGNYVYDGNSELAQVSSIVDGAINYELDYGNLWTNEVCYFENINPIPITEEWLLKFGFSINKKTCVHIFEFEIDDKVNFAVFLYDDEKEALFIKNSARSSKIIFKKRIDYVHQLQNLYFALTQKELEYVG